MKSNLNKDAVIKKGSSSENLGQNVIWNGPFDTTGRPRGQGSSSGKNGMTLNNIKPTCNTTPLAKRKH